MSKKTVLLGLASIVVVFGIALFVVYREEIRGTPGGSYTVALRELGVRLQIPGTVPGVEYTTRAVPLVGTVADLYNEDIRHANPACTLGAVFRIEMRDLAQPKTRLTQESLEAATVWQGDIPPQAKEFPEFYLVFEPSQAVCSDDAEAESRMRTEVWRSIEGAQAT
jgi:hypothetical protein